MANKNISQNKPFQGQPLVRRGAGPQTYKWKPLPFEKRSSITPKSKVNCQNIIEGNQVILIDNVTTYVYDILPDGNHSAYVYCDYVE